MTNAGIKVGLLLHFYQPWWQFNGTLSRIVDECYRPILQWVNDRPGFAFSANFNWSLIELLDRNGYSDVIGLLKSAVVDGKIELFGTAAHHPILPLLAPAEIQRQIVFDGERKAGLGIPASTCGGFYLPEYAFKAKNMSVLRRAGCVFTIADDALFAAQHNGCVPFDRVPVVDGVSVFLRSRNWGNALSFGEYDFDRFNRQFTEGTGAWFAGRTGYVVLATDAETFGHHHRMHIEWLLKPMVECWSREGSSVEIVSFQGLLGFFGKDPLDIAIPPSTWSTEISDFVRGDYYPLWNSPGNVYHRALWRLVNVTRRFGARPEVHEDILKVLSSCFWWQVSGRAPIFNPSLMMIGARKAMEIIERLGNEKALADGRRAFETLVKLPGINR